jgi:Trp operon repressor
MTTTSKLKSIIKDSVREVFQEEIKSILIEALKTPESKKDIKENIDYSKNLLDKKQMYKSILNEMGQGNDTFSFNSSDVSKMSNQSQYNPPPVNTLGEGTRLPDGEVGLDKIMGLLNK